MESNRRSSRVAVLGVVLALGVVFGSCSSDDGSANGYHVVCCDDSSEGLCMCYEGQVCLAVETRVDSCPDYGHNCRDVGESYFCTSWDLPCSETAGASTEVASCP